MSTPSGPGWYDDPDDPSGLRYFDGITWTTRTTAKTTRPAGPPPEPARPDRTTARTPDGVALATYDSRVRAYVVDSLIVLLATAVLGGWFAWQAVQPWVDRLHVAGDDPGVAGRAMESIDGRWMAALVAVNVAVSVIYQLWFLTRRRGATPGKRLAGISVRLLGAPGAPSLEVAVRRVALPALLLALANVAQLAILATAVVLLDLGWPLRDPRRQALHDKLAGTVVVRGGQPD